MPPYRTITSNEEPYFIHDYNAQQSKGLSRHHYYRITTAKGTFEWHRRHCLAKFPPAIPPPAHFVKIFIIYISYASFSY